MSGIGRARSNPTSIGRGRSQGRGNATPWLSQNFKEKNCASVEKVDASLATTKHDKMRANMLLLAEKYADVENDDSSDEEYDEDVIMQLSVKTIQKYQNVLQDDKDDITDQFISDNLQSGGTVTCLVCIENVKRLDAIWSCTQCYCMFHIQCIQKWSRESIGRQALKFDQVVDLNNFLWNCPNCRYEYKQIDCPSKYLCFCRKEENPPFDPWTVPHSCGQQCERALTPICGHECLLLCHPGACPPCPKTVNIRCYCGREGPCIKRCSMKGWSCGKKCDKQLQCGHHTCKELCHDGKCPPCPNKSKRACLCGKTNIILECAKPDWSCKEICGKDLSCGHHKCEKICHPAPCGVCPRSGKRTCPCGKSDSTLPCTEDVPSCGDTCMKPLACGTHKCSKRCHYGSCDTCLQVCMKTCRCGRRKKDIPCSQPFLCDSKCIKTRACGRHPCKKKCCDGNCPPCEQICNRTLNCRSHKCPSPCHTGPCYPCSLTQKVKCYCGYTSFSVPCGREKVVKPPKCKQKCAIPPDCHHSARAPHKCHFGNCPKCTFMCNEKLQSCDHTCQERCHDHIFDRNATEQNKMRSTNKKALKDVYVSLPCPPCKTPVEKRCLGEHVSELFPCNELKPYSCKRPCNRMLACGNHGCQRECHIVKGNPDPGMAGRNCTPCEEICMKQRPKRCIHDCKLPCHPGRCPDCNVHLKIDCHCKGIQIYVKCCEFNTADKETKNKLLCCKAQCPKLMACGHFCAKACHKDECSQTDTCVEKTKVKCDCGRKKKDFPCAVARSESIKVDCDNRCEEIKQKKKQETLEKENSENAAEKKRQQEELDKYERKLQGRKRKQKRNTEIEVEENFFSKYKTWLLFILLIIPAILVTSYFALNM